MLLGMSRYNPTMSLLEQVRDPRSKDKLLLIMDGHAMIHRAWHAIQEPLSVSRTGEDVRAVFGFMNTFLRVLQDWKPSHCAMTFDPPGPTFRHSRFAEYKAHRPPTPPDLRPQFDHVRNLVTLLGIPIYEANGFEADDAIGTICSQAEELGVDTIILTGDTDTLQLVSPHVRVALTYSVGKKTLYDVEKVKERYEGLGPEVVQDIKALEGDSSDNIPGVPGVGRKTAIKLIQQYGSVEGVIDHIHEITPVGLQNKLINSKGSMLEWKFLTTIVRDVPLSLDMTETEFWRYERSGVVDALKELEFFTMIPRIPHIHQDVDQNVQGQLGFMETKEIAKKYEIVDTEESFKAMIQTLSSTSGFAFSVIIPDTNSMDTNMVGISFSNGDGNAWYVPIGHEKNTQLSLPIILKGLQPLFTDKDIPKFTYDANQQMTVLANNDVDINGLNFDVLLAAHILGRKTLTLPILALEILNIEMVRLADLVGTGRNRIQISEIGVENILEYAAAISDVIYQLSEKLEISLKEKKSHRFFNEVEIPLVPVLVRMQNNGVNIDVGLLNMLGNELEDQILNIQREMYEVVGHEFNINSPKQLGDVLSNELRLPLTKKTKSGFSTNAASLEGLKVMIDLGEVSNVDPKALGILDNVLQYRQLTKIKSTYVDALPELVNPYTSRIHTMYNQTGSATGRVSSNDPNVQNIPVRTDLGLRVRQAFIGDKCKGWTLLGADYSQIELRILAHLSQDDRLLDAFHNGQDIHSATASSVYAVNLENVDLEMRRVAKIMNFGVVYGLSAFGISRQTGLSPEEGRSFIETYFGKYPGIQAYINSTKKMVKKLGYVETIMGRRRYIPEVYSRNFHLRGSGERMAINLPIQGSAADAIKISMVNIQSRLDEAKLSALMILQVHDELIFETPQEELEDVKSIILDIMPSALDIDVPLDVDLKEGPNWGDMG